MKKYLIILPIILLIGGCKGSYLATDTYNWDELVYSKVDNTPMFIKDYSPISGKYTLEVDTNNNKGLQNWSQHLYLNEFFQ